MCYSEKCIFKISNQFFYAFFPQISFQEQLFFLKWMMINFRKMSLLKNSIRKSILRVLFLKYASFRSPMMAAMMVPRDSFRRKKLALVTKKDQCCSKKLTFNNTLTFKICFENTLIRKIVEDIYLSFS